MMRTRLVVLLFAAGCVWPANIRALQVSEASKPAIALIGDWQLNPGRTHYGAGVEQRREGRFTCVQGSTVSCTMRSVRGDGRVVTGRFSATLDGSGSPVTGMPDVDEIRLRAVQSGAVDAVFSRRGAPVFGYRAFRAADGRSLMIVSMDPASRTILNTVVVYDRRPR